MNDKKLTDNEIVKALECCIKSSHFGECFENECPMASEKGCKVGKETLYPYALDLINRQKEEIELLNMTLNVTGQIKAEARKEFAERLKAKMTKHSFEYADLLFSANVATAPMVDNLLIEMESEDNG